MSEAATLENKIARLKEFPRSATIIEFPIQPIAEIPEVQLTEAVTVLHSLSNLSTESSTEFDTPAIVPVMNTDAAAPLTFRPAKQQHLLTKIIQGIRTGGKDAGSTGLRLVAERHHGKESC